MSSLNEDNIMPLSIEKAKTMAKEEGLDLARTIVDANKYMIVGSKSYGGYPNVRALARMKNEDLKAFYFVTRAKSRKIKQIKMFKKGCVYVYDANNFQSVMFEGKFKIELNTLVGISDIYKIDKVDPFNFVTIKFITRRVHVYKDYQTYIYKI